MKNPPFLSDLVKEGHVALFDAEIPAHDDHPVITIALVRTMKELGNLFVAESEIPEFPLLDDLFLDVRRLASLLAKRYQALPPAQRLAVLAAIMAVEVQEERPL